nr:MFS transporter [Propionibacterium sp.]
MGRLRRHFADTRPLRTPAFRRLWTANIVTVVGAQLTVVAVPAQLYAITGSSAYVGLAGLFGLVPLVVFGLYGGALADHLDRRTLLILTTVGLIATSGLFFVQAALGLRNVWALLGIFALQQAFFALNQPVRAAILPKLLPVGLIPAAQSLNMTVFSAGAIAGPLIGGALIPVLGFPLLYGLDTLTLFATLYAVVKLPPLPVDNPQGTPGLRSVLDGFGYLQGRTVLLMSFVVDIIAMVFGLARALFPQIAHETFGGPAEGGMVYALLLASMPAGVLLGGVFSGWISRVRRQGLAVVVSIAIWGAAMAAFGLAVGLASVWLVPMLVVALLTQVVGGAADMSSAAFRSAILLAAADDAVRGRLQGIFIVVVAGGPRLADVLHGAGGALIGPAWTAGLGGVLVVLLLAAVVRMFPAFLAYRPAPAAS